MTEPPGGLDLPFPKLDYQARHSLMMPCPRCERYMQLVCLPSPGEIEEMPDDDDEYWVPTWWCCDSCKHDREVSDA